jgi:Xaa-Pro aminopeptidase
VPDVLIYADTLRSPELRHEIPVPVPDPFLYGERDGARHALVHPVEGTRMGHLAVRLHASEEYGFDELLRAGLPSEELRLELLLRAARAWDIAEAVVPWSFPLEVADHLRANGIEVRADREFFAGRLRRKNEFELAGIRRAQASAEAAMDAARQILRRAEPPRCSEIKLELDRVVADRDCSLEIAIVSHGAQTAIGHELGSGQIEPGEPVIVDLAPRDRETGCYADMTRTFVIGEAPAELVEWHRLCLQALEEALGSIRAGVRDTEPFRATCELFRAAGHPTLLDKEEGVPLQDGFYHSLGHGVGLEVHEPPTLGLIGAHDLVAGDVLAVEPGLYRRGFGGVRLEDIVLVTEDGCENLTDFPYDLEP